MLVSTLLRLFLQAFRSKRNILTENALLKKENETLARKMGKKRVVPLHYSILTCPHRLYQCFC